MTPQQEARQATSTAPEDDFAALFAQAFGLEKALLLAPQFPVEDIYGGSRAVDYALRTTEEKIGHFSLIPTTKPTEGDVT